MNKVNSDSELVQRRFSKSEVGGY
ncbi:unnamed protein product [Lathyrus oleraceus]